ncbi:YbhB/YbcL family Raf kinase inhibitor-like protein [Candidatus Gottesmanbacteria bacterium]|nr:YbhB/YbcL family Raf kinase inhibitor-like protein [Candidatus Gottesmanbacteria bacterium]
MKKVAVAGSLVFLGILFLVGVRVWTQKQPVTPSTVPAKGNILTSELSITSPAFANETAIPAVFTCDGENISPPIAISGVPAGAQSLVLIMDDPDAPDGTFTHWILMDIPPQTRMIAKGTVPEGAVEGVTSFDRPGYRGPCPPSGLHRYFFTLFALDRKLGFNNQTTRGALEQAMQGHVLGQTYFYGRYNRR